MYTSKSDNLMKWTNSLKTQTTKLFEEVNTLNSPIPIKRTDTIIKNFPTKKTAGSCGFIGEFYQIFKEK